MHKSKKQNMQDSIIFSANLRIMARCCCFVENSCEQIKLAVCSAHNKHVQQLSSFVGGRSIQDECNDYVRKKGRLMEGQVYLSAAGNLKCKGVIHAVGPVWQNGINQEEGYLRDAVLKSLEVTSARRFTSIAFPALCTGVFGYPVREATRVIVVAVRDFFRENSGSSVVAVYLCGLEKETVNCFAIAMMREMKNVILKSEENENQWKCAQVPVHASKILKVLDPVLYSILCMV